MKALALALSLVVVSEGLAQNPPKGSCESSEAARAVCQVESRLTEALRRNDAALLAEIYADDFTLINFRGTKINKAGVLAALGAGTLRFDSLGISDLDVRVYGAAGIVTGQQHQLAREPGPDAASHPKLVRFTHVYVLREGKWRLIASQITPILPRP